MAKTVSKEEFVRLASEKFQNKFDYSKINYINTGGEIEILCPEHGYFRQKPYKHLLSMYGCQECAKIFRGEKRAHSQEEFLQLCKVKHGELFDYSKAIYSGVFNKVVIICSIHGEFSQSAAAHWRGQGCPQCNPYRKSSTERFICEAKLKHNNKFIYDKVDYKNNATSVLIICPLHGEFDQKPADHIRGITGCPKCGIEQKGISRRSNLDEFVEKAVKIHQDKYIYDKFVYVSAIAKSIIICKTHGEFLQSANTHLGGAGCKGCMKDELRNKYSMGIDKFISLSKDIHQDQYNYDKFVYVNSKTPGIIICKIHGEFLQTPSKHLIGRGCSDCKSIGYNEKAIKNLFKEYDLNFKPQYFLKYVSPTNTTHRFDFYFPELKIAIEYNGRQHYEVTGFSSDKTKNIETFNLIQKRDQFKREFCQSHYIQLLEIDGRKYFGNKLIKHIETQIIPYLQGKTTNVHN